MTSPDEIVEIPARTDHADIAPIFVLGAAHSGTTILYKMLSMHPDVAWSSQYSQRNGRTLGLRRVPFSQGLDRLLRSMFRHDWQKGRKASRWNVIHRLAPRPAEQLALWHGYLLPLLPSDEGSGPTARLYRVFQEEISIPKEEAVRRIRRVIREECDLWGKRFHVSKPLNLYRQIGVLRDAFPNARFVHIVRDGRAVALSNRAKFVHIGMPSTDALGLAARRWLDEVAWVKDRQQIARPIDLRYEDLCRDVHVTLSRLLGLLGLDVTAFPFDRCPPRLRSTNQARLDSASLDDLAALDRQLEPFLSRYGYAVPAAKPDIAENPAARAAQHLTRHGEDDEL